MSVNDDNQGETHFGAVLRQISVKKNLPFSIMHSWPGKVRGGVITVNPDTDCLVTGGQGDQTDSDRLSLIDRLPTEETVSTLTHVSVKQTQFLLPES